VACGGDMPGVLLEAGLDEACPGEPASGGETPESAKCTTGIGVGDVEVGLCAEVVAEDGTGVAFAFAPPGTHPGTRSWGVAGAGPSVTAMQPGRLGNRVPGPTTSWGIGFGAEHPSISAFEAMRPSFSNTGHASSEPLSVVHVEMARESTLLSQPFMKSACSP
jgi:hypothetical protein